MTGPIGRRRFGALAAAAAALPLRPALAAPDGLVKAAQAEGALTWYTAHTDGETANVMADAFMKLYPGIKVSTTRLTAQVVYERLLQELKTGTLQCDIFSSTDIGHDEALKKQGAFLKYVPENAAGLGPMFKGYDPDGYYYPTVAELVVMIYNTRKVKPADAPQSWQDLLDPKWRNQLTVGHPAFSGTVGTWVVAMRKLYGEAYFQKLEKNKPLVGRSVNDAVTVLNAGERMVGAGPSALSRLNAEKGNPIGIVDPKDGAVLITSPSAIMAKAPHPNASKLFMEYLLSPAYAKVSAAAYRIPVRGDAAMPAGDPPLDQIKVIRPTVKEIVDGMGDAIESWRDIFGT